MRHLLQSATMLAVLLTTNSGQALASPKKKPPALSAVDRAAAFKAAGFRLVRGKWRQCDDPGTASYAPGSIAPAGDLNGDGQPEAMITESSVFCFGNTGSGYSLVSRSAKGGWRLIDQDTGIASFLATRGAGGWPDIEVGGPGFCFPVKRWNGKAYVLNRHQYDGRRCRP